ncbi:DMT family transporter [Candidatus Dependentiae bacterium]|nr:DMT family transporter [Candidatus Dependentiae bacterium]
MFIWATTAIQIRLIKCDPYTVIFWSNVIAIFPAILIIALKNFKKNISIFTEYKWILLVVGLMSTVNSITFFYSIRMTTIANALMTHYMTPVIVAVSAPIILKEKFTFITMISLVIAITGLLLIIDVRNLRFESSDFIGSLLGLISAFAYAAVILIGRNFKTNINPFVYIISQSFTALIFMSFLTKYSFWKFDGVSLALLTTFGLFNIAGAAYLFYKSLTKITASSVSIIGYIEPVGAILISVIYLNEPLTVQTIIGGILILSSAAIINIRAN